MSRWFRHYAGLARDDKLVRVALKSEQPIERVVWIYACLLESAAELNEGGRFDFDVSEAAYFLRCDERDIAVVMEWLERGERIDGCRVTKWNERQFKSDSSAARQAAYRERQRTSPQPRQPVTSPSRHRDVSVTAGVTRGLATSDLGLVIEPEPPETTPNAQRPVTRRPPRDSVSRVTSPSRHRDGPETETDINRTHSVRSGETEGSTRGTRLPEGWVPNADDLRFARDLGWNAQRIEACASRYRDYWIAQPGQRGVKVNWPATWRNWVRREQGELVNGNRNHNRADARHETFLAAALGSADEGRR